MTDIEVTILIIITAICTWGLGFIAGTYYKKMKEDNKPPF